jgi:hypothetical protein
LPIKKVPSTQRMGRQCLNDVMQGPKDKKAHLNTLGCPLYTDSMNAVYVPGFHSFRISRTRERLQYDASYEPQRFSSAICFARQAFW